jgi:predicted N-acetyltransferase YhbS
MHPAVYRSAEGLGEVLLGQPARRPDFRIEPAADSVTLAAYQRLRTRVFVDQQGLFTDHDHDDRDDDPRTLALVARNPEGTVLGGVRLGPVDDGPDLGWWCGGRLVVDPDCPVRGVGGALVRAA